MADRKKKKEIVFKESNGHGNSLTRYDDGSYYFSKRNAAGKTVSTYYGTGNAGFYSKNGPDGYKYYENYNTGKRHYLDNSSKSKKKSK